MPKLERDGVALNYVEKGSGDPPVLLIHAWGGDRDFMAPQLEHFSKHHRTIAVDLRGHGESGKPEGEYAMDTFVKDLAFVREQLGLKKPIIVGHSLGGMIALAFAASAPKDVTAVALLDSPIVTPPGLLENFKSVIEPLRSPAYPQVMRQFIGSFVGFSDDPARKEQVLAQMAANPQHAMVSTIEHCLAQDTAADAKKCTVPFLYVASGPWYTDVARLRELCPQLVTGQTVGSGHFHTIEVPDQVNAIVGRFIQLAVAAPAS